MIKPICYYLTVAFIVFTSVIGPAKAHSSASTYWEDPSSGLIFTLSATLSASHPYATVDAVYDYTHLSKRCSIDQFNQRAWENFAEDIQSLSINNNLMNIVGYADMTTQQLHKLATLPPTCQQATMTNNPLVNYDFVADYFSEYFPNIEQRLAQNKQLAPGTSWASLVKYYRSKLNPHSSNTQLFSVIGELLASLEDGHVNLFRGDDIRFSPSLDIRPHSRADLNQFYDQLEQQFHARVGSQRFAVKVNASLMQLAFIDRRYYLKHFHRRLTRYQENRHAIISYGLFQRSPSIGYLSLTQELLDHEEISEKTSKQLFTHAIDQALQYFVAHHCHHIVIDLRNNVGGNDYYSFYLVRHFIRRPTLAYDVKRRFQGHWSHTHKVVLRPINKMAWHEALKKMKLSVLVSPLTFSSGENLAAVLKTLPQTTIIGYPTFGIFAEQVTRQMPNGWLFQIPLGRYTFKDHQSYIATGVTPHIQIPPDKNYLAQRYLARGKDIVLEKILTR